MREDLMAYVLGELDASARQQIERELAENPALEAEIARIRRCLSGDLWADDPEGEEVPCGLADRTSHNIPLWGSEPPLDDQEPAPYRSAASNGFAAGPCNFSMVDMTVAMAVLLALGGLLMPALNSSRSESQRLGCQNNLRELGKMVQLYSKHHSNFLPVVGPQEPAGVFAIRLGDWEDTSREQLTRRLVCPASPLALQLRLTGEPLSLPSYEEYKLARGEERLKIHRTALGSYAVQLGYVRNGSYIPPRHYGHSGLPLMADSPDVAAGRNMGANHGGSTINVLRQDGSVLSHNSCVISSNQDHLYLNDEGKPFAGREWNDNVLTNSYSPPVARPMVIPRKILIRIHGTWNVAPPEGAFPPLAN